MPAGADVPPVYACAARRGSDPLVELPLYPDKARKLWAAHLYFSTLHWRPLPIGRTSFYPPAHDFLAWSLRGFPDDTSLVLLDRLGIRTVVVHPRVWTADERRPRLAALDAEPRLRLAPTFDDVPHVRFAALGLGEERVYALAPGAAAGGALRARRHAARPRGLDGSRPPARATPTPSATATRAPPGRRRCRSAAATAWRSRWPQAATVSAVALGLGYPFDEFPRHLVLAVDDVDAGWQRVDYADGPEERWATLRQLLERPREARLGAALPAAHGARACASWSAGARTTRRGRAGGCRSCALRDVLVSTSAHGRDGRPVPSQTSARASSAFWSRSANVDERARFVPRS